MRVVHILTRLSAAGTEENTLLTCKAQVEAGNEVVVLFGNEADPRMEQAFRASVDAIQISDLVREVSPFQDFTAARRMVRILSDLKPDVVHTHQSKAGIVGRLAARLAGAPIIVHGVHILPFVGESAAKRAMYIFAERLLSTVTDAYINVSSGVRDAGLRQGIGSESKHFVAHSGMPLEVFRNASPPPNWRSLVGVSDDAARPPMISMLAALEPRKRHYEFLKAFRKVADSIPDVRLILAGQGPELPRLRRLVQEEGLEKHVRFVGFHPEPERLIAMSDITVLTSIREGLPRVAIQSLAGGRPIVLMRLPGLEDILVNGENSVIVEPDDFQALADVIAQLLRDEARLKRMKDAAAATKIDSWSNAAMTGKIAEIYSAVGAPAGWSASRRPARMRGA
jgi:glycosyltransferase involved in cell wall biosynthesis